MQLDTAYRRRKRRHDGPSSLLAPSTGQQNKPARLNQVSSAKSACTTLGWKSFEGELFVGNYLIYFHRDSSCSCSLTVTESDFKHLIKCKNLIASFNSQKRSACPGKEFFAPLQSAPQLYHRCLSHWFVPCPKCVCTTSVTMEARLPRANFEGVEEACRMSSSGLLRGAVS